MTTYFASPSGVDTNNGLSAGSPKTLRGADNATVPGDTVRLLAGTYDMSSTFFLNSSGASGSNIIWQGNYNGEAIIQYTGTSTGAVVENNGASYREFRNFTIDGGSTSYLGTVGIANIAGSHHLTFDSLKIRNMGAAGITATATTGTAPDYLTITNNRIFHCGYNPSTAWSSGISLNNQNQLSFFDAGTGFHNIVAYNIICGEVDSSTHHSDGNGIILDGFAPNSLLLGNLLYNNGGSGIRLLDCDSTHAPNGIWVVNNTMWKNVLDKTLASWPSYGEFHMNTVSAMVAVLNNIMVPWNSGSYTWIISGTAPTIAAKGNMGFGGAGTSGVPTSITTDSTQYRTLDPGPFVAAPTLDPTADGQYSTCTPADQIGSAFHLASGAGAINQGFDPALYGSPNSNQLAQINTYKVKDLDGNTRPV